MSLKAKYDKLRQQMSEPTDSWLLNKDVVFRNDFNSYLWSVVEYYENRHFKKYIDVYKNYNLFWWDKKVANKLMDLEWRENSVFPLIKMIVDTLFSSLYDSDIQFKVLPRWKEDVKKADKYQLLVDWMFDTAKVRYRFYETLKEVILLWSSFVKVWLDINNDEIKFFDWKQYKSYTNKNILPELTNVSPFELFVDPAVKELSDARFVFYRKLMPINTALKKYKSILNLNKAQILTIKKQPQYINKKNYSLVKKIHFHEDEFVARAESMITWDSVWTIWTDEIIKQLENLDMLNFFEVLPYDNDVIEVVEYYEWSKMILLFNWYVMYDWQTIFPFEWYPFVAINSEVWNWLYSKWVWINLLDFQKLANLVYNWQADSLKINVSPMFEADEWSIIDDKVDEFFQLTPFKIIKKRWDKPAIQSIEIMKPNSNWFELINSLIQYTEYSEWPNQYSMGGVPVERSATGASLKAQIIKQRLKPLLDNVNESLTEIIRKLSLLLMNYLNKQWKKTLEVRITWEDWYLFKDITIDDILWQYDVILELNSLKSTTMEVERSQLVEFIQQTLQLLDKDPVRQRQLIDRVPLIKKLIKLYNLPSDILISDEKYKKVASDSLATNQEVQQDAQKQLAKENKKEWWNNYAWWNNYTWNNYTWWNNYEQSNKQATQSKTQPPKYNNLQEYDKILRKARNYFW